MAVAWQQTDITNREYDGDTCLGQTVTHARALEDLYHGPGRPDHVIGPSSYIYIYVYVCINTQHTYTYFQSVKNIVLWLPASPHSQDSPRTTIVSGLYGMAEGALLVADALEVRSAAR